MKYKKVLGLIVIITIAAISAWHFNNNNNEITLTDLALSNVEALANGESNWLDCMAAGCLFDPNYDCWVYVNGWAYTVCWDHRG